MRAFAQTRTRKQVPAASSLVQSKAEEHARPANAVAAPKFSSGPQFDFGRIPINPPPGAGIGPRLTDPAGLYEREAERIADQVLATPAPHADSPVMGASAGWSAAAPSELDQVLGGPGSPLGPALRHDMERRFGHDFSQIRVHTDQRASQSAQALGALAYTLGQHVVFSCGALNPTSPAGRRLIAHELAHTIQQREIPGRPMGAATPSFTPSRLAIARQPFGDIPNDKRQIEAQILLVEQSLMLPVQPMRPVLLQRLQALQQRWQMLGGGATPAHTKPRPPRASPQQIEKARLLGEKQGERRKFFDEFGDMATWRVRAFMADEDFRQRMAGLDIYWDEDEEGFRRDAKIARLESEAMANKEAGIAYNEGYYQVVNQPEEESRFHAFGMFLCEHLEPCSSVNEQKQADMANGMSLEEANEHAAQSLFVFGVTAMIGGSSGPGDLVTVGESSPVPFGHPLESPRGFGGGDTAGPSEIPGPNAPPRPIKAGMLNEPIADPVAGAGKANRPAPAPSATVKPATPLQKVLEWENFKKIKGDLTRLKADLASPKNDARLGAEAEVMELEAQIKDGNVPEVRGAAKGPDQPTYEVKARTEPFTSDKNASNFFADRIKLANDQFKGAGTTGKAVINLGTNTSINGKPITPADAQVFVKDALSKGNRGTNISEVVVKDGNGQVIYQGLGD